MKPASSYQRPPQMLNLGRKPGEFVVIGNDIRVYVKRVKADGSVVLGIEAPQEFKILFENQPSVCSNPPASLESEQPDNP
jgi:carbon storage regulator CsrA